MTGETESILLGTSGLSVAAGVALALSLSRAGIAVEHFQSIRWISALTLCAQSLHFAEEYFYQFNLRFPALLGLRMWPETFFVAFNCTWLSIWAVAIASIAKLPRVVMFPLWFLAIASAANGIMHPLIAIAVQGYFPGLWSSPLVGIFGFVLLRKLTLATSAKAKRRGAS